MGFVAEQNRNDNYRELVTSNREYKQRDVILMTLKLEKFMKQGGTPSEIFSYLNETNGGIERFPYTSIRARLSEMENPKDGDKSKQLVYSVENKDPERVGLYGKKETIYYAKYNPDGLF